MLHFFRPDINIAQDGRCHVYLNGNIHIHSLKRTPWSRMCSLEEAYCFCYADGEKNWAWYYSTFSKYYIAAYYCSGMWGNICY